MIADTWIWGFSNKTQNYLIKYLVEILNPWIVLPTKCTKLNFRLMKMVLQYWDGCLLDDVCTSCYQTCVSGFICLFQWTSGTTYPSLHYEGPPLARSKLPSLHTWTYICTNYIWWLPVVLVSVSIIDIVLLIILINYVSICGNVGISNCVLFVISAAKMHNWLMWLI